MHLFAIVQLTFPLIKSFVLMAFLSINSLLCFAPVSSQKFYQKPVIYPKGYFRNPLDIPIKLAANFGELRTNHFHMGFDIRTNQRENLPVYAAADGYVSRINIEKSGFGHAIYITHPNGYTTLYAHLNKYYSALEEFVVNRQYEEEKWEQEIAFTPNQFPVTKGQFIAYSGNTGGSAGPHLHFEIRNTKTGNNLNPWLFDFGLPDNIAPVIYHLYYYNRLRSTYDEAAIPIAIKGSAGKYSSIGSIVDLASPYISFGITAEDKTTPASFNFGIYEAGTTIDDTLRSSFRLNDFSYDETRYLNACIDYKTRFSSGAYIQHLGKLPGNKTSVFAPGGNGSFLIKDSGIHKAKIEVKDAEGNSSVLQFSFRYKPSLQQKNTVEKSAVLFPPNVENVFAEENVIATFSPKAFYDTIPFEHTVEKAENKDAISDIHHLHNYKVPVHDSFSVRIKPTLPVDDSLKKYVVMKMVSNKKITIEKGRWQNDWLEAKSRDLGNFSLLLDKETPQITLYGWVNGTSLSNRTSFSILAKDNLGEVRNANGYVDGKWILFSKKDNLFTHTFDGRVSGGRHELKVVAEDVAGNMRTKTFTFTR